MKTSRMTVSKGLYYAEFAIRRSNRSVWLQAIWKDCSCANDITETIPILLESNKYVKYLLIDFSKDFNSVDYAILLKNLVGYGLGQNVIDWIVSFLSERTLFTEVGTKMSGTKAINLSIVQGSGLGRCLLSS